MGDSSDNVISLTVRGVHTDPAVKEEAFRLWIEYGRSVRRVSERMGLEERTIYRWKAADKWEERRQQEAAAFIPGASVEGAIALRLAAYNAARRLQQLTYDNLENGTPLDDREVKSLVAIASIGGYAPNANRNPTDATLSGHQGESIPDFRVMSTDQLRDYEQQMRRVKRQSSP